MRQVVLDTETTGLDWEPGHRIIEIGCVELVNRRQTGVTWHQYLNPQREIDDAACEVHGLSNKDLADKPLFPDVAAGFLEFVEGAELIIHNAPFDVGFLDNELRLANLESRGIGRVNQVLDTLILARQIHPGQRNGLDALCARYSIDNSCRKLHGALLDARLLAEVYLAMTGGQGKLSISDSSRRGVSHDLSVEEPMKSRSKRGALQGSAGEVLFLDVDGVLSSFATSTDELDPNKVHRLKRIVEACDPLIVVSSSWQFDPEQLRGLVDMIERIGGRFGGTTCGDVNFEEPDDDFLGIRCLEIQGWLDRNGVPNRFVILDDEGDMGHLQTHLVQTDSFKGLTDELSDRVVTQLSS